MNEERPEPTPLTVAVITTSFPRYLGDEASLFLKRSVDAIHQRGIRTLIFVPYDRTEQEYESLGAHGSIHRVRYGIFRRGQLAFGQGILPNLRRNRWLALQIIPLLFQLFAAPFRHRKEWNLLHGHWVVTALPLFFLHLLTGKPYLITIRGEDVKLLRTPLRALFGILLSKAGAITTVSHDFEEELKGYYPGLSEKVQCIPNGVTRFEHEQSTPDTQELIFSYVGRVVPLKQPEVLIEIISELSQQSDLTPHLFLAGRVTDEYRTELQEKAHALGIGSQLHLTGSLSPAEIGALYHRSTLYLSASQHEGRSNSVLEALAAGLPAALSDIPGHRELVSDGEQGILFSSDNPTKAAQRIHHLLKDSETHRQLKERAQQSVSHLTWEAHAAAFQNLYRQVLARK